MVIPPCNLGNGMHAVHETITPKSDRAGRAHAVKCDLKQSGAGEAHPADC